MIFIVFTIVVLAFQLSCGTTKKEDKGYEGSGMCGNSLKLTCSPLESLEENPCRKVGFDYEEVENVICFDGKQVSNNPRQFEILESDFAIGVDHIERKVFCMGQGLSNSEGFQLLADGYSKNDDSVFHGCGVVNDANPNQFKKIPPRNQYEDDSNENHFYGDGNNIFHFGGNLARKINTQVQYSTFIYFGGPFFSVNEMIYSNFYERPGYDPKIFEFLGCYRGNNIPEEYLSLVTLPPENNYCYYKNGELGSETIPDY